MLTPKMAPNNASKSLFLAEPSPLPEIDSWVEEYIQSKRRFTFTEDEVLKSLWNEGEDIRLREDSRFRRVKLLQQVTGIQWQLAIHTMANQHLYELLLDELWDGNDLHRCLGNLDQHTADSSFHIFCLGDERFLLSQDENSLYRLTLSADVASVELTMKQKNIIDQLAPKLLAHFPNDSRKPWTTSSILGALKGWSHPDDILDEVIPAALENWLLYQEDWVRVGVDSWLPKSKLPSVLAKHRYAVLPIFSATDSPTVALPNVMNEEELIGDATQMVEQSIESQEQQPVNKHVRWRITLRTCHINEGTIPVPTKARSFYPHARKLARMIALQGLWFNDGSDMTVWLDREKHRLFGLDLQEQFAFLEAGEVLEVEWTMSGLVFGILGIDSDVADEESRLIDLTYLSQLRSTTLESYRVSLRAILSEQNKALSFETLYEELCIRQQHKPNRSTVRTILSSSPEFVFVKAEGTWTLNTEVTLAAGAKSVRRITVVAKEVVDDGSWTQQEPKPLSLTQMIAKNRQQISTLRSLYLSDDNLDVFRNP